MLVSQKFRTQRACFKVSSNLTVTREAMWKHRPSCFCIRLYVKKLKGVGGRRGAHGKGRAGAGIGVQQ